MEEEEYYDDENLPTIAYKIKPDTIYTVIKQERNGKAFYKILISKKHKDDKVETGQKLVRFHSGVELEDKTKIKIKKAFEDFYNKDMFTTIWTLFIDDFEIVSQSAETINEAYKEFGMDSSELDLPF